MAQQNRSKELWLIPKRGNLHQTICLIDGIIDRNYSGTSWNPSKQDNLGVNLKKWGATNDGKNISRTLCCSIETRKIELKSGSEHGNIWKGVIKNEQFSKIKKNE